MKSMRLGRAEAQRLVGLRGAKQPRTLIRTVREPWYLTVIYSTAGNELAVGRAIWLPLTTVIPR
jgi:hypothetical protein